MKKDEAPEQSAAPGNLKRAVWRAAGCCLLVLVILNVWPRAYPAASASVLPLLVEAGPDAFGLRAVSVSPNEITMDASSVGLTAITLSNGHAAPGFDYTASLGIRNIHVYPIIVLGLFMGWPLTLRARWVGLAVAFPLLVLAGAFDAYASILVIGAEMTNRVWAQIASQVLMTPENQLAISAVQAGLRRIDRLGTFFNNGGRGFLACLAFIASLVPAMAVASRRAGGGSTGRPGRPENEEDTRGQHEQRLP
jgi:hypothetical protein